MKQSFPSHWLRPQSKDVTRNRFLTGSRLGHLVRIAKAIGGFFSQDFGVG